MMPGLSTPFDVVIVGAGPAGASLACRLAEAGMRVAVLDASRFPRDKLCGEFLSPECWRILQDLGLASEVSRSGYEPIRSVRLSTPRGSVIDASIGGPDELPGIGLSRSTLDALLVTRARNAGAEVYEGMRVGGPLIRDGRVAGVVVRHPSEEVIEVEASVVIVANGRHSALVQSTGSTIGTDRFRPRLLGMKRHFVTEEPSFREAPGSVELHLLPGGYGGTCRVEAGVSNFCALLPERVLRRHGGSLDRVADEYFVKNPLLAARLSRSAPLGPWKTVAGVRIEMSRPHLPGVLYAGDCQGTVDPLAGQGMTMALLCGEVLVPFIKRGVSNGCVDSTIQREYETAWRKRFKRRIALCRAFHHVLTNPSLVDAGSAFSPLARRVLTACYAQTRDRTRDCVAT